MLEQAPGGTCEPLERGGHTGSGGYTLKEVVTSWRVRAGVGFWQEQWPVGRPLPDQSIPEGPYAMERIHTGTVLEELQQMGRTHVEAVG